MNLTHRPTALTDLEACLPLIRNGFSFGPDDRPDLLALWRHLLSGNMTESVVIEDQTWPAGRRVVGFGLSVFVNDQFVEETKTAPTPYVARHVLCRWREGRPPFLNAEQIRHANSLGGLNGLILHNGWGAAGGAEEETPMVRRMIMDAFLVHHCGYRLKCFLHEIYGTAERDKMTALGWHLENDYASAAPHRAPSSENHHDRPFLMSLRRGDALGNAFHPFYDLFNTERPRLFFRPTEQALLRRALAGEGDSEIAAALGVSPFTIHKRWRAIYEKTAGHEWCPLPEAEGTGRGPEKRSRLLRYLNHHPEELRPVSPPRRGDKE